MESNIKHYSAEELIPPLLELLKNTDCVPLGISGGSMTPFLINHRDTVYLSKVRHPLKKGDIILYRRDNGRYVLHRIYRVMAGTYTMIGDAQTILEQGVRPDQILAIVTAVHRKGKLLHPGSFWWEFFRSIWIHLIPLRPMLLTIYSRVKSLF